VPAKVEKANRHAFFIFYALLGNVFGRMMSTMQALCQTAAGI